MPLEAVPMGGAAISKPKQNTRSEPPGDPEEYAAMPKREPKQQSTNCKARCHCIEKSAIIIHAEKCSRL